MRSCVSRSPKSGNKTAWITEERLQSHCGARMLLVLLTTVLVGGCAASSAPVLAEEPVARRPCLPESENNGSRFEAYAYFARAVTYEARAKDAFLSARTSRTERTEKIEIALTGWQQAVEYFQETLRLDPECGPAYSHLGLGYLYFRDKENALRYLRLASEHDPDNFEVHVMLAVLAEQMGRADEALSEYEKALKVSDCPAKVMMLHDIYLRLVELYERAKMGDQALGKLRELSAFVKQLPLKYAHNSTLRQWRDNPVSLHLRAARLLMKQGKTEAALTDLQEAQKLSPDNPEVQMLLAQAYSDRGDYAQALEVCRKLLDRQPRNEEALVLLADLHERAGDPAEARKVYQQLLARHSRRSEPYERLSALLAAEGDPAQALVVVAKGVEAEAPWEKLASHIDELLEKVGNAKEALQRALESTEESSRRFCFYFICGRLAELAEDGASAIQFYEKSKELYPSFSPAYAYQALAQVKMGKSADAIVTLERALAKNVFIPHLNELLGKLYFEENRLSDAEEAFQQELKQHGGSPAAHFYLGMTYERLAKTSLAEQELQQAVELDPENPAILNAFALFYLRHRMHTDEAIKLVQRALEKEPDKPELVSNLAWAHYLKGDRPEANMLLERAEALAGEDVEAQYYIASVLHRLEMQEQSETKLLHILTLEPGHAPSNNDLGYLYAQQDKNLEEAEAMVKLALEKEPDNAAYIDSLGWVYFKQGKLEAALEQLQRAGLRASDPEIYEHLGDVLDKLERKDEARDAWHKALELEPDRASLKQKLEAVEEPEEHPSEGDGRTSVPKT